MTILERIRRDKNLTQVELAHKCGITQGMISSYESEDPAKRRTPELRIALKIAAALNTNVESIWALNRECSDHN